MSTARVRIVASGRPNVGCLSVRAPSCPGLFRRQGSLHDQQPQTKGASRERVVPADCEPSPTVFVDESLLLPELIRARGLVAESRLAAVPARLVVVWPLNAAPRTSQPSLGGLSTFVALECGHQVKEGTNTTRRSTVLGRFRRCPVSLLQPVSVVLGRAFE